jgi:hypothetical protein
MACLWYAGDMAWTLTEIENDWLGGGAGSVASLALSPEATVAAFDRVESTLGRAWIDECRISGGMVVRGTAPTLRVVNMGRRLVVLEGLLGTEELIEHIRRGDESAEAELTAIFLIRSQRITAQVELYPPVGDRVADFRVRDRDDAWTYVEVTQPDWSEATERARTILDHVATLATDIKRSFALEVFLRREPTEEEVAQLMQTIPMLCNQEGTQRRELPAQLGLLLLNESRPGLIVTNDHGEEVRPRIGMARAIAGPGDPHRHIAVRMAFSDERAEAFLTSEARQLPKDAPGMVMIGVSRAPGAFRSWERLLTRRFQPKMHTRVSAVCLFGGGLLSTPEGEAWLPQTKLVLNRHATFRLPAWIEVAVIEAGAEYLLTAGPPSSTRGLVSTTW